MAAPVSTSPGLRTERRIAWLTLLAGAIAGVTAALLHDLMWASGLMIGSVLSWLNLRWLRQGLDALVNAAEAQSGAEKVRVPVGTYFRAMFRYALIAFTAYVIFKVLKVPLASMAFGMCALGAAAVAASVYEIARPERVE
jgi:small-conductance mechanosensitive channel